MSDKMSLTTDIQRLTEIDLKVIGALYHGGKSPIEKLASSIKLKPHVFRYSQQKLLELEIITLQPFVNTYAFGGNQCELYIELATSNVKKIKKFESHLIDNQNVPWIGKYLGRFQYGLTFLAEDLNDIHKRSEELLGDYSDLISNYQLVLRKEYLEFPLKIFQTNIQKSKEDFRIGGYKKTSKIDKVDHQIIKELSASPFLSFRELGDKIGMHHSSVHQRIKNLEDAGILAGWAYYVSFEKLGLLNYTFLISLKNLSKKTLEAVKAFCRENRNVLYVSEGSGSWNVKISSVFYQPIEASNFLNLINESFGDSISEMEVLTALDHLKVMRYPLEEFISNA